MKTLKQNKAAMLPTSAARQHQFLQRAGMLSFAALLLGVGTASAQQNHFLHAVADPTWLASTLSAHFTVQSVDIDGDLDIDLFLSDGGYNQGQTIFLKNQGTPASPDYVIQGSRYGLENHSTNSFVFGDMDNDGDQDILYRKYHPSSVASDTIVYISNRGTATAPDFTGATSDLFTIPVAGILYSMSLADLDNDGDLDLLTFDSYQRAAYYTNNSRTSPSFVAGTVPANIAVHSPGAHYFFVDMDNDGDQDLWRTFEYPLPSEIAYSENTGSISSPIFNTFQPFPMHMDSLYDGTNIRIATEVSASFDIDDDGDMDFLSFSGVSDQNRKSNFFENTKCDTNNTAPVVTQSSNTISTGAGLSSYQWYSVDAQGVRTPVQGATGATFAPITDGSYTVRAKKTNGCVAYSADFAFVHIGVNSVADANLWNISPNPVTSELFVQSDLTWLRWEIIDAQGRVIRTIAKPTTNSINVSELPQGIYTLRGQAADGKSAISRFVKK